jgi:hypothetical protein
MTTMQHRRLTIDVILWGDADLNSPGIFMSVVKDLINALPFITVQNIRNEPFNPAEDDLARNKRRADAFRQVRVAQGHITQEEADEESNMDAEPNDRPNLWEHEQLGDWQYAVSNGDTLRSFSEWLQWEAE